MLVGARLYFEDKSIQHAGIIIGIDGIAGNALVNLPYGKHAYFGREAATRNTSAVTGACLFCRKELYEEVGYMKPKREYFNGFFEKINSAAGFRKLRVLTNTFLKVLH